MSEENIDSLVSKASALVTEATLQMRTDVRHTEHVDNSKGIRVLVSRDLAGGTRIVIATTTWLKNNRGYGEI